MEISQWTVAANAKLFCFILTLCYDIKSLRNHDKITKLHLNPFKRLFGSQSQDFGFLGKKQSQTAQ